MDEIEDEPVWLWTQGDEALLDGITKPIQITAYELQALLSTAKCVNCGKRWHPEALDEVGFCDYCAING